MASRILNRKELRHQAEMAEETGAQKVPARKKSARSKGQSDTGRLKACWGVFDHMLKQVALFPYNQRDVADRKAEELAEKKKKPYVIQLVKEKME